MVFTRRRRQLWATCCTLLVSVVHTFLVPTHQRNSRNAISLYSNAGNDHSSAPHARLVGYIPQDEKENLVHALTIAGFQYDEEKNSHQYSYSKATGMLNLIGEQRSNDVPRWIPTVRGEENVLVANGWSFLDPDENEPLSAFDVDAANIEGQYIPKWDNNDDNNEETLSSLGFSLKQLSSENIRQEASRLQDLTRSVLLEGATDPPQRKLTHNGHDFTGSASQSDLPRGIFCCALGGLPLFSSVDLSPTTATSGWLSFARPLSEDHVVLVQPEPDSPDQRIEVLCAKTKCHMGHHFGKGNGYCINASALNFIPQDCLEKNSRVAMPVSWRALERDDLPSVQLLHSTCRAAVATETVAFGAGCFWHVEFALRHLPGVVSTETGYAGGTTLSPTYEDVCRDDTGHAEVVRVEFDPNVLDRRILMDCFLAMHDPTKVRAMGKHARGTGQYRSCVFVTSPEMESVARQALDDCRNQLQKELSTQVYHVQNSWFWTAEERHQRHDEKRGDQDLSTLSTSEWLQLYGKRKESVWGSANTLSALTSI